MVLDWDTSISARTTRKLVGGLQRTSQLGAGRALHHVWSVPMSTWRAWMQAAGHLQRLWWEPCVVYSSFTKQALRDLHARSRDSHVSARLPSRHGPSSSASGVNLQRGRLGAGPPFIYSTALFRDVVGPTRSHVQRHVTWRQVPIST